MRSARLAFFVGFLPLALVTLAACKEDPKLKVTGIEPKVGDYKGGTFVRITGNRFAKDGARSVKIYFGGRQAATPRIASDTEMVVVAPGGEIGEVVDVLATFEPGGELKIAKAFTFVEKVQSTVEDLDTSKKK